MTATASAVKGAARYRHEALFYEDGRDFLAAVAAFVRHGMATGEPTMVVLEAPKLDALRAELRGDSRAQGAPLVLADMATVGGNPARIIPAWRRFVDEHGAGGRPVRGVGEAISAGRPPAELVECQLHEVLLNVAFAPDAPFHLVCPYNTTTLSGPVLEEARRSHAFVRFGASCSTPSADYRACPTPDVLFRSPLPEPTPPVAVERFGRSDLTELRHRVRRTACEAGLGERADDVALAVHEAAANSVRHGGGGGDLRTWVDDGALVFEVSNPGRFDDVLAGRIAPKPEDPSGRGMWLMNHVCDLVQVRNTPAGAVVRLHVRAHA